MKKYYLHNGTEQQGPFDIDDLKAKAITKDTSIWYEGLSDWTTADKVDELNGLFKLATPPPYKTQVATPPPIQNTQTQQPLPAKLLTNKKSKLLPAFYTIVGLFVVIVLGLFIAKIINSNQNNGTGTSGGTYQEKVMSVEEIERSQPSNFLKAEGNYNLNFWGNYIKVHGVINSSATVASYKDAIVRVTYYSKTKTKLVQKDYTIYEMFKPHSKTNFELKIENYKEVNSIGLDVIAAKPN